ncbi:MAG: hypothetical protein RI963_3505 [Planctomycetota bacterium]|jgi:hypothetical protein
MSPVVSHLSPIAGWYGEMAGQMRLTSSRGMGSQFEGVGNGTFALILAPARLFNVVFAVKRSSRPREE